MSRSLDDWIYSYMEYSQNTEPPELYHLACAISIVGGALSRKVWLPWGFQDIYPNMFFVLIGPSGKCRKGTSMDIAELFMSKAAINLAPESTTREALIKHIEGCRDSFLDNDTNETIFHCSVHIFSKEFGVFIGKESYKMIEDLCDLYDARSRWIYQTKNSGTNHIENVCLNLLAATTPSWLQGSMPSDAIGHGLCSRIIFVVADQKQKLVPFPFLSDRQKQLAPKLEADLDQICLITGECKLTKEVAELYENWYRASEEKPPFEHPKFEGYVARRPTHLRKLAIISSAARSSDRVVRSEDFHRALKILELFEVPMLKAFGAHGLSRLSQVTDDVLRYLAARKKVSKSDLLSRFWNDADITEMDKIVTMLKQMKRVETTMENGELVFSIREEV